MTMELVVGISVSVLVGLASGALGAYVAIKVMANEIKWMNKILDKHDSEIDRLHDRMTKHVSVYHGSGDVP